MVEYVGMSVKSKKRSHSSDKAGSKSSGNASRGPVQNKKRQRGSGEGINDGGTEAGAGGAEEQMEKSKNDLVNNPVNISESKRRKRKRVERQDNEGTRAAKDGDGIVAAGEAGKSSRSATDAEALSSKINAATTKSTALTLTPLQIQKFDIPDEVTTKIFSHEWDLLCIRVRQSSRIRCKVRAALGHLFPAEAHQRQKKDVQAKEHERGNQSTISNESIANTKNGNYGKNNIIRSKDNKKPTCVILLQASADAASKLISIVEIVKRESAQNQRWCTCFQYSGIEGRVEDLRPRKKHKRKGSNGLNGKAASINADSKTKTNEDMAQQQELSNSNTDNADRSGGFQIKDVSILTADAMRPKLIMDAPLDETRCSEATLMETHVSDSELESESDAFQTLAESRKKLRNVPYLTIYLSRTRVPLLSSAYGLSFGSSIISLSPAISSQTMFLDS